MLSNWVEARTTVQTTVVSLTVGLAALAGLALWTSLSMQQAATHVHELNEMSDHWGLVVQNVDVADHALTDYVRSGTKVMREPVANAAGAADESLRWLRDNGGPADVRAATIVGDLYRDYSGLLRETVAAGDRDDPTTSLQKAYQAELTLVSLRKQLSTVVQLKRLETTEYLRAAEVRNGNLRLAALIAFAVDLGLVALCGVVLLGHRRQILRQAARSEHEALHDALTGLANRTLLTQHTEQAIRRSNQTGDPLGLFLIDLNRFKPINDTLGHAFGDKLLQLVANRLTGAVREIDTVARLGGDEFAVLLPSVSTSANALIVAERVHRALAEAATVDGLAVDVGCSIGVALYPTDSADAHELLKHADLAMYAAKRARLGTSVYEAVLDQHSAAQLTVISDLRRALDQSELVLHYQPKADLRTGEVCGAEVLCRWQHPRHGLLGPDRFIPAAEETGLIEPLTQYVLDHALAQCRTWHLTGWDVPVSVNVGAQCLHDRTFPDQVAALLEHHGRPADVLTLEITESAIIADPHRACDVLTRLRELGVRLSIDDFGTGYSSIAYLRTMPVHEMKIDRSFTTNMRTDASSGAITRSLLGLAHNLELEVVAEGVEDEETWSVLAALGCDIVQGYCLSKPLPADEFGTWLRDRVSNGVSNGVGAPAP
ncbi:bifunctional diguanylate cyclase/phosphodiesterase [Lentzea sp. HUAS12]|uniref:putative bifunctional diguanylate cyclase/phosphodiesterase n=1 Tax=Lentzea sp. HUAS12 TaxID=2951806 RepID=UPI00209F725C|nr:bifunctional diguanylate cyclase/phosphodiesterase [Lentzea sp. HUAS12]USX53026.1 bifunctional diguanylate cyclase/phosphodiesterase [Lentzea sp. HUAS12]